MSVEVQIYRGAERRLWGRLSLFELVRLAMHAVLGRPPAPGALRVEIYAVEDDGGLDGAPRIVNLTHGLGYARVTVREDGRVIYQHPHQVLEIVGRPLQAVLRRAQPEEQEWAFAIVGLDLPRDLHPGSRGEGVELPRDVPHDVRPAPRGVGLDLPRDAHPGSRGEGFDVPHDVRPAPRVEGAVRVRPYGPGEKPAFQIRRLPEEPPPLARLEHFGVAVGAAEREAAVKVVLSAALAEEIEHTRPLSPRWEEGGFLVGRVYRDEDAGGTYLAEVLAAPDAEHTGASLFHFTFTGDSFGAVKRALREEHAGQRLLGWFHTHLFPAGDGLGLSSIDVHLHFTTFTLPWQLAALINLDDGGQRTLRFYARSGDTMVLCPHRVRP